MTEATVNVPKKKHSILIGPGGANINRIREACGSGFQITIPGRTDESDEVKLSGTPAQIEIGKEKINELLTPVSRYVMGEVSVPKELHWAVIGEKGKNIQKIKANSSVQAIIVPKVDEVSDIIKIQASTQQQIEQAKQMIESFVSQHQQKTLEADELYKKYRKQTQIHAENRKKYFDAAADAYKAGNRAEAAELSKKGKHEHHKMLKSQNHAAMKIFKAKNKDSLACGNIDLHGLHARESVALVNIYLYKFQKKGRQSATIICGKGLHSEGAAVIKPSIIEFLDSKGFKYVEDVEHGSIVVSF